MSDQFTEITTESWGGRIAGSIAALLFGLFLLPAAIFVLYWNEGRAVTAATALSHAAASVIEVEPGAVDPRNDGRLVHLTGMMQPATPARDPLFGVSADGLLRLTRTAQTYQWQQTISSHSENNLGGSKTTVKTYSYGKVWSERAINSGSFRYPQGHENPPVMLQSGNFDGGMVTIGAYRVTPAVLRQVNAFNPLHLDQSTPPDGFRVEGDGFYRGQDAGQPEVGDVKVSFSAVPSQIFSVAAAQWDGSLTAFRGTGGYTIVLAEPGVATAEAMFQDAKHAASQITWILRGAGFAAVLLAFICMTQPLTIMFAVIPFLESLVGAGAFLFALTLAVPVTLVTIAVAWIAHRPLLGWGLLAGALLSLLVLRLLHPRRVVRQG